MVPRAYVIPNGISTKITVAAFFQGLTAWTMISECVIVQPGQWVLAHAAACGVGSMLTQMLRNVGAKVIAMAGTKEELEQAKKMGADSTVLSSDEGMVYRIMKFTKGHGVDVIFDGVGAVTFESDMRIIADKGHLVIYGAAVSSQ